MIKFEGALEKAGEAYALNGNLTIRDVTRPIKPDAEFTGYGRGFAGDERAGFEASGKLGRKDYGLAWNIAAFGGGLVQPGNTACVIRIVFLNIILKNK